MAAKEKMTAPIASVGADVEQPLSNKLTNQSIADLPGKGNLQATNNAENTAKSANKKNPDDLETVSMMELYDTAYPPKLPIVDGLLYNERNLPVCRFAENWKIILYGTDRVSHQ